MAGSPGWKLLQEKGCVPPFHTSGRLHVHDIRQDARLQASHLACMAYCMVDPGRRSVEPAALAPQLP